MKILGRLFWAGLFFLFWGIISALGVFHPLVLPSPVEVLYRTGQDLLSGELLFSLFLFPRDDRGGLLFPLLLQRF